MKWPLRVVLALIALGTTANAVECRDLTVEGNRFTVCEVDPENQQIDLFQDSISMVRLYQAMDRMKHRFDNPSLIRRATGFSAYEQKG